MHRSTFGLFSPAALLALAVLAPARANEDDKRAPYPAIRWQERTAEVLHEGVWHALLAVDGVPVERLIAQAEAWSSDAWQRRFDEDLLELLRRLGRPAGDAVSLELRRLDTGETRVFERVPLTREHRAAIVAARRERPPRAARETAPARLTAEQVREDLRVLGAALESAYAYRRLRSVDLVAGLAGIERDAAAGLERWRFAAAVAELLAQFGDGHTRVRELDEILPRGWLPFDLTPLGERLVARKGDGSLYVADRPFVVALDGQPVERCLAAAERFVARGSPAFVRRHAARKLRAFQFLRHVLGIERSAEAPVRVMFAGPGGEAVELEVSLAPHPVSAHLLPKPTRRLDPHALGFLRIQQMSADAAFLDGLDRAMNDFRATRGLIIDVRGNGGGDRAALAVLFPYFMKPDDPPRVANIAAYRLDPNEAGQPPDDRLSDRRLHPLTSDRWTPAERRAIARTAERFQPEWTPPPEEFSAWHYFVLSPRDDAAIYHYDHPVIVLMDEGCFSATDIFLAAMKGWRRVTLVGAPSGGGSGRARGLRLPQSGLTLALSSMASFRPDGRLYDGRGVEPDIAIEPTLSDLIGQTDRALDAAVRLLTQP